ncbi:Macrolide export ATP-binding/permease protein MacB (EC [Lentimonas sp. CC4]|nr:Macrolide export ATP-binding/permease protein MacB (EC [Lentimonas sp. CC4]CAA6684627.1 Macrolide export ATP-binding/permease protein MacB (EC [Lentimonas sp. CC6]CAA7075263.1 Macrolide export ATP-binding/permease protein MacB (EC [Lentimonas sp. CC4]CAA7170648.1 Macrolide export ATP-binding/permease protein MacB (EC [Lentimonas sp. CC21]CAA7182329.1 Macrolide export ATP-binding/permease protein MacB (EC [Lentimonas sp. CC8]
MFAMLGNAFLIAIREIRRNLTRAFLTVLGIIIGVAAVITMVTLGDGTTQAVKNQISDLGSNLVMVRPGSGFGPRSRSAGVPNFSEADVVAIDEQIAGIAAIAPVRNTSLSTIYRQEARSTQITGTHASYFEINSWTLAEGRFFDDSEVLHADAVAVIGNTVKTELFGSEDPIGQKIRVGRASLLVIGLLKSKGQAGMGDQDDTIVVPLTTMQRRLGGRASGRDVSQISISADEDFDSDLLISDISSLLRQRRNIQGNQDDNFNVFDTRQIAETLSSSTQLMTTLLTAVAGVSLLVGGIGIMNIMLVSVTERTREIGIRLAIGATAREVLWQFLVEALTLSCVGGLIGIGLAFAFCSLLAPMIQVPFAFNLQINCIAFVFSAVVGIVFGFAPARRAAKLDPIDALRHE